MSSSNVVQLSAARSRKRDRNHIATEQEEHHVIHDGGGGSPPIVVQVVLKLPDDVVEENKVPMKTKPVIGFWTTLIMALTFGFWLSG